MRRILASLLLVVCISSLFSCTQYQSVEPFPPLQPTDFSEYLDNENFIPELSQGEFLNQMGEYHYEGTPLAEALVGYYYDGPYGGGYSASGEYAGFYNDYTATEDDKYATYSNRFHTNIPLDGLTLPYEITFDDTLITVLQKLNINIDMQNDFVSDKDSQGTMTLRSNDSSVLTLTNCLLLADESGKPLYGFELRYTEKYHTTRKDGRDTNVTRSVILSFTDENYMLGKFEVAVVEIYKIN